MLELTFSLLRSSLLPLWVSAFTSKLFSMKLHQSVVFFLFNRLCVVFVFNVCVWFSVVFSMTLVYGFIDPSCNTIVSLTTSVVFGYT